MDSILQSNTGKPGSMAVLQTSPILHVLTMVSNPVRYKSRYKLFRDFVQRMQGVPGINLVTVEVAYGDRAFEVTTPGPQSVQLRTADELWHKENALNVGISRLPSDWEYVAWLDADIQFVNPNWAAETVHQLQHHHVVQMFQDAVDLGPTGQVLEKHSSLASVYLSGVPLQQLSNSQYGYGKFGHPGFAWAAGRDAINAMGGLLDFGILGAGDHHQALALIGGAEYSMPGGITAAYHDDVMEFQARCESGIKRDVGFVEGTILHHFHGAKRNRQYESRWDIVTKNQFDPRKDIVKDWQGLYQLKPGLIQLRDDIRRYFRSRNEDGVDL